MSAQTKEPRKGGDANVVDFISRVPVSMLLEEEQHRETRDPALEDKLLQLATTMANQRDTVMMLMENQRRIDQLRASALVSPVPLSWPRILLGVALCALALTLTQICAERRPPAHGGNVYRV